MIVISLLRPSPRFMLNVCDDVWRHTCASQLVEHLGIENAERIAAACTDAAFELVPCDPAGCCFIDIPADIAACPGFDEAVAQLRGATEANVADAEYDIEAQSFEELDDFHGFDDLADRLSDPEALARVQERAAELMEGILADARAIWNNERNRAAQWYGNVLDAVTGPFVNPESVAAVDEEDLPAEIDLFPRLNVFYPSSFFPAGAFGYTMHDPRPDGRPSLEAEADLPHGYRAESWVHPETMDLMKVTNARAGELERLWEQRGFACQFLPSGTGMFGIGGQLFYEYSEIFSSSWQTAVVSSLGTIVDGRTHVFTLSKTFENAQAPDDDYAERVLNAIAGVLRSMAAKLAGVVTPTVDTIPCMPGFAPANLIRFSTTIATGTASMSTLVVTLGGAIEEKVSAIYETPVPVEAFDGGNLGDRKIESRILRFGLPRPDNCALYATITRADDCFVIELLEPVGNDGPTTLDTLDDVQDTIHNTLNEMRVYWTSYTESLAFPTVFEIFVPHFRADKLHVFDVLASEAMPKMMEEDGMPARVEHRNETNEEVDLRTVETTVHDDEHHVAGFLRVLLSNDTASVTCGIVFDEGYVECAGASAFISSFTKCSIACAEELFCVLPSDLAGEAEPWSYHLATRYTDLCCAVLGEHLGGSYITFIERQGAESAGAEVPGNAAEEEPAAEVAASPMTENAATCVPGATPEPATTPAAGTEPAAVPASVPATAPAPVAAPASAPAPKFCYHCGAPLSPGARFCASCGTQVAS